MGSSENNGHHTKFDPDSQSDKSFWDVLVLDDDPEVHDVTARALDNLNFYGRTVRCIHTYSCAQAKEVLTSNPQTALLLLDIAVEKARDGLDLIHWIRQKNASLQIAVRTGKTEIFTEEDIVDAYDINDFLSKTDATYLRLKILVKKAIRTHNIQSKLEAELAHRSRMEKRLQEKESQLRDLIENIGDLVWQTDNRGHFTFISGQAVTGYSASEFTGRPYEFSMTDDCLKDRWPELRQTMARNEPFSNVEITRLHKNGHIRHYLTSGTPLSGSAGDRGGYRGAEKDITDLVNAESEKKTLIAQLRQAQRLEAMGTLAGGIAHDFNNILGGIMGYAQLLQFDLKENSKALSYIDHILAGCNRAKNLILQILEFSRQRERTRPEKLTDPVRIVNETMRLFRASLPSSIRLNAEIERDIGCIRADPSQIHQAIMNLFTNASHAIETAMGEIGIRVKARELTPENHTRSPALDLDYGKYITISVQDTGKGIEQDVVDQIFNPYFTTKTRGDGTGLGLSVVHGIVTRFNGIVTLDTRPGSGSIFTLYFPEYRSKEEPDDKPRPPSIIQSSARVMFIDDEPMLVDIGRMMLEKMGFRVTATQDPLAGLERIRDTPDRYDIVITDMTMPQIHGAKLALKIKKINPNISIILATGFSNIVQTQNATPAGIDAVLPKPITMGSLSRTLHELLSK